MTSEEDVQRISGYVPTGLTSEDEIRDHLRDRFTSKTMPDSAVKVFANRIAKSRDEGPKEPDWDKIGEMLPEERTIEVPKGREMVTVEQTRTGYKKLRTRSGDFRYKNPEGQWTSSRAFNVSKSRTKDE